MKSRTRHATGPRCAECRARRLGLCALLPPDLHRRLCAIAEQKDYVAGQPLWRQGTDREPLGVLIGGHVRVQAYRMDGQRRILELAVPGDILDSRMRCEAGCLVEAASSATACWFDRAQFTRLAALHPQIQGALRELTETRLDRLRLWTWALGTLSRDERVSAFIVLATRHMRFEPLPAGGGLLTMDLSRADIADYLDTTPESISRITHRLQSKGLIRIRSPRQFEIPDLGLLVRSSFLGRVFDDLAYPATLLQAARTATGPAARLAPMQAPPIPGLEARPIPLPPAQPL